MKFVPDWFVTSKMIEKLDTVVFYNDYIVFGLIVFGADFVTFFTSDIGPNSITLSNINFDDRNLDDCDAGTNNYVKLVAGHNK